MDAWAKLVWEEFDDTLIEELKYIATLLIVDRHYRVLTIMTQLFLNTFA